jgi:hypothetical protein
VLVLVGVVLLAEILSGRWQIINCLCFAWVLGGGGRNDDE